MRIRSRWTGGWARFAVLAALAPLVAAGCASHRHRDARGESCPAGDGSCPHPGPHGMRGMHAMHHGFASDVETVQVVSALVGGKNVYIPSTIVVTDGGPRTLSLLNTTEMPHGFAIAALGIELVLQPGQETLLPLPPLQGGQVLRIHCHMHPAHRTATLVVLPGRPSGPPASPAAPPPGPPAPATPPAEHPH
jgi:hypothetical protein